jgi:hypothetical protein
MLITQADPGSDLSALTPLTSISIHHPRATINSL